MSNDKAEAASHGRPRAYLVDDWVRFNQLPHFDSVRGQIVEIHDRPYPYLVRLQDGHYVSADWLELEPDPFLSTGEQVKAKISNSEQEEYRNIGLRLSGGERADWLTRDPEGYFAAVHQEAQEQAASHMRQRRGWTPTPGELGLALGIVMFIIVLFVFSVAFYPGW